MYVDTTVPVKGQTQIIAEQVKNWQSAKSYMADSPEKTREERLEKKRREADQLRRWGETPQKRHARLERQVYFQKHRASETEDQRAESPK